MVMVDSLINMARHSKVIGRMVNSLVKLPLSLTIVYIKEPLLLILDQMDTVKKNINNGDWYKGEYKQGEKTGVGHFKWANGKEYYGQVQNSMMEGEGTFLWPVRRWANNTTNRKRYQGFFSNGKRHKKLPLSLLNRGPDWLRYSKPYPFCIKKCFLQLYFSKIEIPSLNNQHGKGMIIYDDDVKIEGYWKNGEPDGEIKTLDKDENLLKTQFLKNGEEL
jgi:antitoxin component YwqK of YwqJK toxin-antitoxin module